MREADVALFERLFKSSAERCFGHQLLEPLSESESKHLSSAILEATGLVIGWRSIKNYSLFVLKGSLDRQENPSLATLDTFARYVSGAPKSDEVRRQKFESDFPYWFRYREDLSGESRSRAGSRWAMVSLFSVPLAVLVMALAVFHPLHPDPPGRVEDDFRSLQEDSLARRGWNVAQREGEYWSLRGANPGCLTLYTLRGDNWPDSSHSPGIRNLLFRELGADCFTVEVHLADFIPRRNWQQAGILLLEDTAFARRWVRLSISYNDYAGGFKGPHDVLVQAVTSLGNGFEKPEEVAHRVIFSLDKADDALVAANMKTSALRIEKRGSRLRFLASAGPLENSAFREIASSEFPFVPRYAGIFAMRGFVDSAGAAPVKITYFSLAAVPCGP